MITIKFNSIEYEADDVWELLSDVPVTEDDDIDEPFLDFPKGTDKFEIWHWFEETFDVSIAQRYFNLP